MRNMFMLQTGESLIHFKPMSSYRWFLDKNNKMEPMDMVVTIYLIL